LRGAHLEGANLFGTNLEEAYLFGTNLEEADLGGAYLNNSCLCNTDLKNVKHLSREQLLEVFSLYKVKNLDQKLKEEVKKRKPSLFEPNYEVKGCNDEYEGEFFLDYMKQKNNSTK
jgi:uncharacterized protein YjbI with pentapeptide repeats